MKKFYQIYIKVLIRLHNYFYRKISKISSRINNNIHPKHRIMEYNRFFSDNINKDSTVLDIGCNIGIISYDLAKKAQKVVAIDIDKSSIKIAKRRFYRDNIVYINADATNYDFKEKFDYIVLSNVLEHIKNRRVFLNKIKRLGKYILIRVPMINRSWLTLYKKELGLEYRLNNSHYIEYTLETFKREIENVGLNIISYSIQYGEIWAVIESEIKS